MSSTSILAKVALPYAEALLESAQNANSIEQTKKDMVFIADTLLESKELNLFLGNPLIESKAKKTVLHKLFINQINSSVLNFLLVLVERRRITMLNAIIEKYLELAYQLDSTKIVKVITSLAFTESQQGALIDKLKQMTNSKQIKLDIQIDPKLIGGFKVQVGSKVIDTSLAGKLKQMSLYLESN